MFSVAAYLVETRMGEQVYSGSPSLSGVHGPHENSFFFFPFLSPLRGDRHLQTEGEGGGFPGYLLLTQLLARVPP